MIKRIELINFMSHRHTVIEPADGLTVLIGPNNCGKSAFVTALQILCHNSKSGFVLRHGEKKCEVIVETTDGHVINWSRKKNGSGIYVIDGEPFDRLRGSVPAEVHEILKMPKVQCDKEEFDVHFGEQSEPVFLLRDRGKASAQFFASSSDATHLVAMQGLHKSKVLVHKRDFKQLTRQHESITGQLEALDPVVELEKKLAAAEQQHVALQATATKLKQIKKLVVVIQTAQASSDRYTKQAAPLKSLASPPAIADERPLGELVAGIASAAARGAVSQAMTAAFSELVAAPAIKPADPLEHLLRQIKAKQAAGQQSSELAASFESLSSAPAIADAAPLEHLLQQIKTKQAVGHQSSELAAAFEPLSPTPAITDATPLADLLQQIKTKQTAGRQSSELAASFELLSPTPVIADASALQQLLQKLQDRHRTSQVVEGLLATVQQVPSMPEPADIVAFGQLLDLIGARQTGLQQKMDQCQQTQQQLAALHGEFEQWVDANPVCPTCGNQTDAEHVLQRHDHAASETQGESRG